MIATDVARVAPAARLRGDLRLPGDKSISHRALLLATLIVGIAVVAGARVLCGSERNIDD